MWKLELPITDDIVNACADVVGRDTAIKGARILCRYFGGTIVYIPVKKKDGHIIKEINSVLNEFIGEHNTEKMLNKIMAIMGGNCVYFPMERTAFKNAIALEIYQRYNDEGVTVREMCRDYCMSFATIYQLWKKGRRIKLGKEKIICS
jgi:Mor family transcriptional regulator